MNQMSGCGPARFSRSVCLSHIPPLERGLDVTGVNGMRGWTEVMLHGPAIVLEEISRQCDLEGFRGGCGGFHRSSLLSPGIAFHRGALLVDDDALWHGASIGPKHCHGIRCIVDEVMDPATWLKGRVAIR